MLCVKVTITRFTDMAFPGWVACSLIDASAHEHVFDEKIPMVTTAVFELPGAFPQAGFIACVVVGQNVRDDGRMLVLIDTNTPFGIASTTGQTRFEVLSEQLCELPRDEDGG